MNFIFKDESIFYLTVYKVTDHCITSPIMNRGIPESALKCVNIKCEYSCCVTHVDGFFRINHPELFVRKAKVRWGQL